MDSQHINLYMIANFNEQQISVDGVTIWFGLKRAQFRLRLQNGIIPIESIDTSQFTNFQVDLIGGSENNISWDFKVKTTESTVLKGQIYKTKLGTVSKCMQQRSVQNFNMADSGICSVEATFRIMPSVRDICITNIYYETSNLPQEVIALFEQNDKKFKRVVEQKIVRNYIQPLFQPCILQAAFDV